MIELKYFKNIHGRIINAKKNSFVLSDACIYADKDNNRYCYLTIVNKVKDVLLSVLLSVRQYDATGQFLKESKFYIPNCYHLSGEFEIDEPIPVERECDAVEVFVERAVFSSKGLVNDRFVGLKNIPEPFASPVATPVASSIDVVAPVASPVVEEVAVAQPVANEAQSLFNPDGSVNEAVAQGNIEEPSVASEGEVPAPVAENQEAVPAEPVKNGKGSFSIKKKMYWIVPILIGLLIIAIFVYIWLTTYGVSLDEFQSGTGI